MNLALHELTATALCHNAQMNSPSFFFLILSLKLPHLSLRLGARLHAIYLGLT